jgi:hypothetical protein
LVSLIGVPSLPVSHAGGNRRGDRAQPASLFVANASCSSAHTIGAWRTHCDDAARGAKDVNYVIEIDTLPGGAGSWRG